MITLQHLQDFTTRLQQQYNGNVIQQTVYPFDQVDQEDVQGQLWTLLYRSNGLCGDRIRSDSNGNFDRVQAPYMVREGYPVSVKSVDREIEQINSQISVLQDQLGKLREKRCKIRRRLDKTVIRCLSPQNLESFYEYGQLETYM